MQSANPLRLGLIISSILVLGACGGGTGGLAAVQTPVLAPAYFNRNIDQEAHEQMGRMYQEGIAVFAFHPGGGWVIVTLEGNKFARNIPQECNEKLEQYLAAGHEIRSIAFPPLGGNRWVIVTDHAKFARNIPSECNQKLEEYIAQGRQLRCVAFPGGRGPGDSWVVLADDAFFVRNIDDECYQLMRNLFQAPRPGADASRKIHFVAFEPDGGWVILADDYFFARNIDGECYTRLNTYYGQLRETALVAFDPDGTGWSIVSNHRLLVRRPRDEVEKFEAAVGGKTLWKRMRDYNVPGVSVAVVIDNQLAWATAYGHLTVGQEPAVHPESLFQAASISKVLTAIGMHRLVDDGAITLGDDIRDFLGATIPARGCLMAQPDIVLSQVLTHTSSVMGRGTTYPLTACSAFTGGGGGYGGYDPTGDLPTVDEIIAGSTPARTPAITRSRSAGGQFSYSGDAFTLLQILVEDLTLETFSDWMETEILRPMGMDDSYFRTTVPGRYFDDQQVAAGYKSDGAPITEVDNSSKPIARRRYPEMAAAGLYSTAVDLAQVVRMLNNDGLVDGNQTLSQAGRDDMVLNGIGIFRGGSFASQSNFYTHGGTNAGFRCVLAGFPALGTGVVVMTNGDAGGQTFRVEIAQAVIDAYGW